MGWGYVIALTFVIWTWIDLKDWDPDNTNKKQQKNLKNSEQKNKERRMEGEIKSALMK